MSNLLVTKLYTITDHTQWPDDRSAETDLVENYGAMCDLMAQSGRDFITDLDDVVIHKGEAENIRDVFKIHFYEIYELWQQGHNILYADTDVVFLKPVEYFDKFDQFMMFNYTHGGQAGTQCNHYGVKLPHFFNCGIRYYPQNMDQEIWDIGIKMVENWNPNRWNSEQVIYNVMLWSQKLTKSPLLPDIAYQYISDDIHICDQHNRISLSEAKTVHLHGSKGSRNRLEVMKDLMSEQN